MKSIFTLVHYYPMGIWYLWNRAGSSAQRKICYDLKKLVDDLQDEDELCEHLSSAFFEFQIMKKNISNVEAISNIMTRKVKYFPSRWTIWKEVT